MSFMGVEVKISILVWCYHDCVCDCDCDWGVSNVA